MADADETATEGALSLAPGEGALEASDTPEPLNASEPQGTSAADEGLVVAIDGVEVPDVLASEALPASSPEGRDSPPQAVPHWTGWVLLALGLFTLPWTAGLAVTLPDRAEAAHYNISWAGFDILLCLLLLRTGWALLHSRRYVEVSAAMTAALLVVDSWFDVMSAPDTGDFVTALAMALCVQIPLATFCLWVSARVEFERRRRSDLMAAVVRRLVHRQRQAQRARRR